MKPHLRLVATGVLFATALLSFAADPPKPSRPLRNPEPVATQPPTQSDPWQRKLPTFELDGLPMSEVANLLSENKFFPEINFLVDPAAREMVVPQLKLRSATLDDVFTALNISLQGALQINKINESMVSFTYGKDAESDSKKAICRAFSLSRYLAGKADKDVDKAMQDVQGALSVCWEMLQRADRSTARPEPPQLSLHRATKLLIVVGQPDQIAVVEQVIGQLEGVAAVGPLIDPSTGLPAGGFSSPGAAGSGASTSSSTIPGPGVK